MKVLFLGKAENEASVRYRVLPLMQHLNGEGSEAEFLSSDLNFFQKIKLVLEVSKFDVLFIQRKLFSAFFVSQLRSRVKCLVFDYDDAIFVKSSGQVSSRRSNRFDAVCQAADLVFAGNEFLAARARQGGAAHAKVHKLPTSVATQEYRTGKTEKEQKSTLVWIGSSSTRRYLDMLTPVLDRLADQALQLKVISDFDFHLDSMSVVNVPWSEEHEISELQSCHIGIAPMIDNSWTRGKCALKVLQYMAAGLPVVSSNYGANAEVIDHGESGLLVESEEDWCNAILKLLESESLQADMARAGQQKVVEDYDQQDNARLAVDLIKESLSAIP